MRTDRRQRFHNDVPSIAGAILRNIGLEKALPSRGESRWFRNGEDAAGGSRVESERTISSQIRSENVDKVVLWLFITFDSAPPVPLLHSPIVHRPRAAAWIRWHERRCESRCIRYLYCHGGVSRSTISISRPRSLARHRTEREKNATRTRQRLPARKNGAMRSSLLIYIASQRAAGIRLLASKQKERATNPPFLPGYD
jgi:hypothetical protein